jgi:hypothetical protein
MKKWVRSGLVWGGLLYIITIIALPMLSGEQLSYYKIIMGIPLWIAAGLAIGYLFEKKGTAKKKSRR